MSSRSTKMARNLRKKATEAENLLSRHLRAKQLDGLKFRRQQPIGNYIVDFVCFERRVIVEVDGGKHTADKDNERDKWFREQGFRVLRFWDNEVLTNMDGVLETIRQTCLNHPPLASFDYAQDRPPIEGGELKGSALVKEWEPEGVDCRRRTAILAHELSTLAGLGASIQTGNATHIESDIESAMILRT